MSLRTHLPSGSMRRRVALPRHCAAMRSDNFIIKNAGPELAAVLAPKVTGTVRLDEATEDVHLAWFVLFSALAGAMGNPGQSGDAAANGLLDQSAAHRNRLVGA